MKEKSFADFLQAYEIAARGPGPFVVVTLVNAKGSSPQDIGARMIIGRSGLQWGTVGGGKLEKRAIEEAQKVLLDKKSQRHFCEWNLQTEIGMTCGGLVQLFFEKHDKESLWQVVIFGAGHVGQALVRVLLPLEVQLTCIDSRAEWIDKLPKHPNLKVIVSPQMDLEVEKLSTEAFLVVMTMGHATDLPILKQALVRDFAYVGNMGSVQKAKVLQKDLGEAGLTERQIGNLFCPIGEKFGNNSPAEIAISVTAQLLKIRDQILDS